MIKKKTSQNQFNICGVIMFVLTQNISHWITSYKLNYYDLIHCLELWSNKWERKKDWNAIVRKKEKTIIISVSTCNRKFFDHILLNLLTFSNNYKVVIHIQAIYLSFIKITICQSFHFIIFNKIDNERNHKMKISWIDYAT